MVIVKAVLLIFQESKEFSGNGNIFPHTTEAGAMKGHFWMILSSLDLPYPAKVLYHLLI